MSRALAVAVIVSLAAMLGCRGSRRSSAAADRTVVMLIESSPNNLDLRQGTDAQSERIGALIFDALVKKDDHYNLIPWLATSWEQPDPLTWVFHLRDGVRFHNGQPLTSEDVAYTIDSMTDGGLITAKGGSFASVFSVVPTGRLTLTVHLKRPDSGLLFNLSDGLFGVVPKGSGRELGLAPIGSGPFRFVSAVQDKEVVLKSNENYWAGAPKLGRVRFSVVPDQITTALEMRKGSADIESNAMTLDMVHALRDAPNLAVATRPSSVVVYLNFNVQDPHLSDRRVRQAIAFALDRQAIVDALWRGQATLADSLLPPGHWARAADSELAQYPWNPGRARQLLDSAGLKPDAKGIRLRLTLKTSTDETTRLLAAILQQQLRAVGIELSIRSAEFGTFYSDITHGAFQLYALRWIGSNEDPDIFRYAYSSRSFPPKGGNRGHYVSREVDALLSAADSTSDLKLRRADYVRVQQILAEDLPGVVLWYPSNEVVYNRRLAGIAPAGSGNFDYLNTASLR